MRENNIIIKLGDKNSGKTKNTKRQLRNEFHIAYNRILIIDIKGEYIDYNALDLSRMRNDVIEQDKIYGIYRIDLSELTIQNSRDILDYVYNFYDNGMVIFENLELLYNDPSNNLIAFLSAHRTRNLDVIINTSSVKFFCHPKIIGNMDLLYLFKYNCNFEKYKKRLADYPKLYEILNKGINTEFEIIDINANEIKKISDKKESEILKLLGEKTFSDLKNIRALKKFAVDTKQFELASELRLLEIETADITDNDKDSIDLAYKLTKVAEMIGIKSDEATVYGLHLAFKLFEEKKQDFSLIDASLIKTELERLFN